MASENQPKTAKQLREEQIVAVVEAVERACQYHHRRVTPGTRQSSSVTVNTQEIRTALLAGAPGGVLDRSVWGHDGRRGVPNLLPRLRTAVERGLLVQVGAPGRRLSYFTTTKLAAEVKAELALSLHERIDRAVRIVGEGCAKNRALDPDRPQRWPFEDHDYRLRTELEIAAGHGVIRTPRLGHYGNGGWLTTELHHEWRAAIDAQEAARLSIRERVTRAQEDLRIIAQATPGFSDERGASVTISLAEAEALLPLLTDHSS
jgi:hypothetical protein